MGNFIPVEPEKWAEMVKALAEVERLKAEVEDLIEGLNAQGTRLLALSFENERLRKAGDAMAGAIPRLATNQVTAEKAVEMMKAWNAAKEGKQS